MSYPNSDLAQKTLKQLEREFGPRLLLEIIDEVCTDTGSRVIAIKYNVSLFTVVLLRRMPEYCVSYVIDRYRGLLRKHSDAVMLRMNRPAGQKPSI